MMLDPLHHLWVPRDQMPQKVASFFFCFCFQLSENSMIIRHREILAIWGHSIQDLRPEKLLVPSEDPESGVDNFGGQ